MARIVGVHHTSFTVADLDRSVAFFRDVLESHVGTDRTPHVQELGDLFFGDEIDLQVQVTSSLGMFRHSILPHEYKA